MEKVEMSRKTVTTLARLLGPESLAAKVLVAADELEAEGRVFRVFAVESGFYVQYLEDDR